MLYIKEAVLFFTLTMQMPLKCKQKRKPSFKAFRLERVMGIEPTSPAWKAGALAVVLHPHLLCCFTAEFIIYSLMGFVNTIFYV